MTNVRAMYWKLLPRSLLRRWGTPATIENFKPSVTGEVLGENRRSYRRGCERRFVFGQFLRVSLPRHCCRSNQLLQFSYRFRWGFFLLIDVSSGNDRRKISPGLTRKRHEMSVLCIC